MAVRRAVDIDDLYEIKALNDARSSPDGTKVAYVVTQMDRDENGYKAAIWIYDLEQGTAKRLTSGKHRDGKPTWSPDSRTLYFTSDRKSGDEKGGQIWKISLDGGEPIKLSSLAESIEEYAVSPDGRQIACVSRVRECDPNPGSDVRVIRTPRYRFDGEGYLDDKYRQLFVIDVASGDARQLTEGPFDRRNPAWSPNGYELAYTTDLSERWEYTSNRDVYVIRVSSGANRRLTDGAGQWAQPAWSPDGSQIAFYGTKNLKSGFARTEIFVATSRGENLRSITAEYDRSFGSGAGADIIALPGRPPIWSDDSAQIYSTYGDRGSVRVATVEVESGEVTTLTDEGQGVGALNVLPNGDIVCLVGSVTNPSDLYRLSDGTLERLTDVNVDWHEQVAPQEAEPVTAKSVGGREIHGWLIKPPGFDASKKYPLLLEIHGGPFGMYSEMMMHEFQVLAGRGYLVLYTNPVGSTGYGDAHAEALGTTWGEADMPDLMAALDEVISRGYVDEARLGVLGGSYGGFMTNWVIGHTDRFSAAVTQRTLSDLMSAWGTDDIFFSDENTTLGGTPWEQPEHYEKYSPITYVKNMVTPLLIVQSEEDYRCTMGQAEQLFISLKRLGRTTEFVRFPNESHGLSRGGQPKHRAERLQHFVRWFDTYL